MQLTPAGTKTLTLGNNGGTVSIHGLLATLTPDVIAARDAATAAASTATTKAGEASTSATNAATSETNAAASAAAAQAVGSTNDTIIAGRINDPTSATAASLSATYDPLPHVASTVATSGPGVVSKHNPVDASAAARSISLPTGQAEGKQISVEKVDATANAVSITGNIRGVAASTLTLVWQYESIMLRADSTGSWWPVAGHKTKAALDAVYTNVSVPFARNFMDILENDSANLVLAVSGDSKSNETGEWVQLFATKLGVRYPKYTIVIKHKTDAVNTYQADVTIQTGAGGGGHTLTIYNWSQSGAGSGVGMDDATMPTSYPVAPDLFLVATGANDDVSTGTTTHTRLVSQAIRRVAACWPNATFAIALLNPHAAADSGYQNLFAASRNMVAIAGDLGIGIMNLQRAWLTRSGGYADLLTDTKHPNAAGSALLAQTAFDQFVSSLAGPLVPSRRRRISDQLYVPLMGGFAKTGSPAPTIQATYGNAAGIAFDGTADEAWIIGPIEFPEWWQAFSVEMDWSPTTNGAGNAAIELKYTVIAPGNTGGASAFGGAYCAAPATSSGKGVTSTLVGTSPAFTIPANAHTNGLTNGVNYPLQFRISRLAGSDALDTLDGVDIIVYGLRFIRYA